MPRAMIKIQTTKRPISQEVIGFRLMACIENEAGNNFGKPAPSFRKPYFIMEGSDEPTITAGHVARFLDNVRWQGYTEFVAVGEVGDLMAAL